MTVPYGPGACYRNHGKKAVLIIGTTGAQGGWPVCWHHVYHQIKVALRWRRNPALGGRLIWRRRRGQS